MSFGIGNANVMPLMHLERQMFVTVKDRGAGFVAMHGDLHASFRVDGDNGGTFLLIVVGGTIDHMRFFVDRRQSGQPHPKRHRHGRRRTHGWQSSGLLAVEHQRVALVVFLLATTADITWIAQTFEIGRAATTSGTTQGTTAGIGSRLVGRQRITTEHLFHRSWIGGGHREGAEQQTDPDHLLFSTPSFASGGGLSPVLDF